MTTAQAFAFIAIVALVIAPVLLLIWTDRGGF